VLELLTCSCRPAVDPESVVRAFTELVLPRLKIPPTPVPASATEAVSVTIETTAPITTPEKNAGVLLKSVRMVLPPDRRPGWATNNHAALTATALVQAEVDTSLITSEPTRFAR